MNDPKFEYGFYEPPLEKMEPGKLMLREVMEVNLNRELSIMDNFLVALCKDRN
jgi:hypothetical protein